MNKFFLIGAGGFFGSILRYFLSGVVYRLFSSKPLLPYGTLFVNITGCFLIGLISGLVENRQLMKPELRLFIMIGLLGGFTTFSTFAFESFGYLRDAEFMPFFLNTTLHVVLGVVAVWLGYACSEIM